MFNDIPSFLIGVNKLYNLKESTGNLCIVTHVQQEFVNCMTLILGRLCFDKSISLSTCLRTEDIELPVGNNCYLCQL